MVEPASFDGVAGRSFLRVRTGSSAWASADCHAARLATRHNLQDTLRLLHLVDFFGLLTEYKNELQSYEEIAEFFQSALTYRYPPKGMNSWMSIAFDNYKFLTYELFLYLIAIPIKAKRFDESNQFLEREFYVANPHGEDRFWAFADFRPYLDSIEAQRKQRLKLNRVSIMADLLKERSTRRDIGLAELAEADVVLYLRSYLRKSRNQVWYPNTIVYREINGGPAKLFRMSESNKHFSALKIILGVGPAASGPSLLQQFLANGGKLDLSQSSGWPISLNSLVDFNKLGTRP